MAEADTIKLVSNHPSSTKRSLSYTEPYEFSTEVNHKHYRAGLSRGCCQFEDAMALRMIVAWMALVAIVVFVALVVEIITTSHQVTVGDIVTDHPNCSQIGVEILEDGGNAVDAAVGAALCLAVATPDKAGFGGGGVMLIHQLRLNKTSVIDFQEVSPKNLPLQQYQDNPKIAQWGVKSTGVPGLVAGLYHAQQNFGSRLVRFKCCSWTDIITKTIKLLNKGFVMNQDWKKGLDLNRRKLPQDLKIFLDENGYSQRGSSFNKEILKTLDLLFDNPVENFYNKTIAQKMVKDTEGHISLEDLNSYTVVERPGLIGTIGVHQVVTSPSPTSGPELLAILNTMERLVMETNSTTSGETEEYFNKLKQSLENIHHQQRLLGDPKVDQDYKDRADTNYISTDDRTQFLTSKDNVYKLMSDMSQSGLHTEATDYFQDGTQVSVMDDKDVYVSMILSLNGRLGSGQFTSGFLLNNAMAGFDQSSLQADGGSDGGEVGSNQLYEDKRPLYRGAPVVTVNTEATCQTRVVTGSVLAEMAAQVLGHVLLEKNADYKGLLEDPKYVIVDNAVKVQDSAKYPNSQILKHASKNNIPKVASNVQVSNMNLLEKTIDAVFGHSQLEGEDYWRTLKP